MRDGDKFSLGVTRRTFMAGLGGVAAVSVIGSSALAAAGKEAPELAALVKDGKLPPLAERLPKTRWW